MPSLYEINTDIRLLIDACVDSETGEWIATEEQEAELNALELDRTTKLQNIAKYCINLRADQKSLKDEEARLAEKRKRLEKKEAALVNMLDREAKGEKLELGVATYSYRTSTRLEFTDEEKAVTWAYNNAPEFLITSVHVNKADLKAFMKQNGETSVDGAQLVTERKGGLR